jgi:aryl-alcohol dehydrogenase-like predicted oxidoreductase
VRDPSVLVGNFCSYVDVYDLCEATVLAVESVLPGHEVLYVASPDTIGGHPLEAMVTRRLGSAGPEITTLGFGTWALAGRYRFGWGPADDDESVAAIRRAVEAGINWIDTAATYGDGHSEEVVGRALEPFRAGEDVLVFTKCGRPWRGGEVYYDLRPESIREECHASLRRLGIERIDLYQFHWPDHRTGTPVEESCETMVELVEEGKVRWVGVCNFEVPLLERCTAVRHVDSLQPPLSLLNRYALRELVPWARENGTGVIAYSPMASGLLTGSFNREGLARLAEDDWRRRAPAFQEPQLSRNLALVSRLEPLAARLGVTVAALSLAWVLAVPGVTGVIVGGRRPSQLDDWLGAGDVGLDQEAVAEIEALLEETGAGTDEVPQPPPR